MKLTAPPLTVALLTYNRLHYFKEAIEAVLNQSYTDYELLVLDNCSTDGTAEFVLGLRDPRIRYVRNAANKSTVEFNCLSAYHLALGDRVIASHDDDIMESNLLERQMKLLDDHPEVRLVWTRVSDIDQTGEQIQGRLELDTQDRIFRPGEYIVSFLNERLWPMPSGVMLQRAALPRNYSMNAFFNQKSAPADAAGIKDVLLPASINRKNCIGYIGEPLLRRRVHTNQFSHAASLSRPGVYLYRELKKAAKSVPGLESQSLHFDILVARFDIQEAITNTEGCTVKKRLTNKVAGLTSLLRNNIDTSPDAFMAGLPILILNSFINPSDHFEKLDQLSGGLNTSSQKFLAWAQRINSGSHSGLLESLSGKRIVIFGSAFVAALLVLEGHKRNFRIVACVDSNINRHGRKLLSIPIQPLDWMAAHVEQSDVIIMSSERDHEHYIEAIIRRKIQSTATIVSWKELI